METAAVSIGVAREAEGTESLAENVCLSGKDIPMFVYW
jgi:hypothetical protein